MKLIKIAVIAVVFLGFQNGVVYAQDAEVKDAKTERTGRAEEERSRAERIAKEIARGQEGTVSESFISEREILTEEKRR